MLVEQEKVHFLRHPRNSNGSGCSREGKKYELDVHNVVSKVINKENGLRFNTQKENELGGCSSRPDIICNFYEQGDLCIEVKKKLTPDWMQCVLKFNMEERRWKPSTKTSNKTRPIFTELLNNMPFKLFNERIPQFCVRSITHKEWIRMKSETTDFNDQYFSCPSNTIADLYYAKGCKYIQISEKGLYYLRNDTCNFNVPLFSCMQKVRIRTKVHRRKNPKGFCSLSVTLSCIPRNINDLVSSDYSLDDISRIPNNLIAEIKEGIQCKATKHNGKRCKRRTKAENGYCFSHKSKMNFKN